MRGLPPIAAPCLGVVGLLAWWTADRSGYPVELWAPGLLIVLALLALALVLVPNAWGELPRPVAIAVGLLGGYTVWSYASMLWAEDPGAAFEGATRTLLYLVVFALFALWPQTGRGALTVLAAWVLLVGAVAAVVTFLLASDADPRSLFSDDRMIDPAGYPNAVAGTWLMALLPAVALAASARVPWWVRSGAAATAVLGCGLALLALSRGGLVSTPVVIVAFLVLVPGRVRHVLALGVIAACVAPAVPALLDVGDALDSGGGSPVPAIHTAGATLLAVAAAAAVIAALAGLYEARRRPDARRDATFARAGQVLAGAAVALVLVGGLAVAGNPVTRAQDAWNSFKGGYGDLDPDAPRLVGGLGSNRYDFYRVGVDVFSAHPLIGIGADNFQQEYLVRGDSEETPRYPHSLELRTLAQTGVVGALLLFGAFAFALVAVGRALRFAEDPLAATVAGGGLMAFAYWGVHGSVDWFFEYAGLGVAAFALLGLGCSLCPRPARADGRRPFLTRARGPAELGAIAAVALVCAVPAVLLWVAERDQQVAGEVFADRPGESLDRLDRAASLLPFSDAPLLLEGSIALRLKDVARADRAFARALERVPGNQYATLQRGAIASTRGDRAGAERFLRRAVRLAPRDPTAREALQVVRAGGAIDLDELSRRILSANAF